MITYDYLVFIYISMFLAIKDVKYFAIQLVVNEVKWLILIFREKK